MTLRTTSRWVIFQNDFRLGKSTEIFPAGRYEVEDDEEVTDTATRTVARHVGSFLVVTASGSTRMCKIVRPELDVALAADVVPR